MSDRQFHMRMRVEYAQPDNAVAGLQVERQVEGQWQGFPLNTLSPGFEIFVYALFTCQHTYLRLNAAEQGLELVNAVGEITLGTDEDWMLDKLALAFEVKLGKGEPSASVINYIIERMQQCPVSKNIGPIADTDVSVIFF